MLFLLLMLFCITIQGGSKQSDTEGGGDQQKKSAKTLNYNYTFQLDECLKAADALTTLVASLIEHFTQ